LRRKYSYVRYTWWREVDIDELSRELSTEFKVKHLPNPSNPRYEFSLFMDARREVLVKADTLKAYISRFRAVLFQSLYTSTSPLLMRLGMAPLSIRGTSLHEMSP